MTGHLVDAGLRHEKLERYESACRDGDRLVLRYTARIEKADGEAIARRPAAAAVPLAALAAEPPPPVDALAVDRLAPASGRRDAGCERIALLAPGGAPAAGSSMSRLADGSGAPAAWVVEREGAPFALMVVSGPPAPVTFYSAALTRSLTAPWVYPLLPFTVVVDVVVAVPATVLALPYLLFEQ